MNNKVYDISGKKKIWFIISLALIAAIAVITVIKGVEIAIEFKGGTIISYSYEGDAQLRTHSPKSKIFCKITCCYSGR